MNELNMFKIDEINSIIEEFIKTTKDAGYGCTINANIKNLGYGGFCNINEEYVIKLHIFPYPKFIGIDLIQKYESFIMDGKSINSYQLREIDENTNLLSFVSESTKKLIEEVK